MEEIQALHNLNIEWGCITNLMDKISNIEDKIEGGWPELVDMVADAVSEEGEKKTDSADLFFNLYQFLWRLYYRLKNNSEKRPFNVVRRTGTACTDGNGYYDPWFYIYNYDYPTFKWLKSIGCGDRISNEYAIVPEDKLTDKQRRAFERKAKEAIW